MNKWSAVSALWTMPLALYSFVAAGADPLEGAWGPTTAAPPMVVILGPESSDDVTTQATARVNGELKAAGFEVVILPLSGGDPRRDLETAGRELHPLAAFAIFVRRLESGSSVAEIWVSDRIKRQTIIQTAVLDDTDRGRGSEILAVRAVEILKARLADFWAPDAASGINVSAAATKSHPPLREAEETPGTPFAAGLGGGLGAGVVDSFGAMPMTWAPQAMASYGWADGLSLRASFHGLGPEVTLSAKVPQTDPMPLTGTARVERQMTMLEAVKTWWPRLAVVPFVCAGAGVQHLHIIGGSPSPILRGHTSDEWSVLTTIGTGIGIPMLFGLSLLVQARGVASWPSVAVTVHGPNGAQAEAGRVGAPSLLVDGTVLGVLP